MARRHVTAEALATVTLSRQTKRRTVIFQWVASKMLFDQNVRSLTMCRLECRSKGIGTFFMDRDPVQQDSPTRHLHALNPPHYDRCPVLAHCLNRPHCNLYITSSTCDFGLTTFFHEQYIQWLNHIVLGYCHMIFVTP